MALPQNLSKEHLLKAIEKIDQEGIPEDADSQYYDVIYHGKKYPPKLIISYANFFANGEYIKRSTFDGGVKKTSFKILNDHGFRIIKRMANTNDSFYEELLRFLNQVKTNDLKKKGYLKLYNGFSVKIGFGQGNQARIPWIAFLKDQNTVQKGIYPGFLYYKKNNLLILAYCISETHKSLNKWNIINAITIEEYFKEENLGKPERYGKSYVYKVFDLSVLPEKKDIDESLSSVFAMYMATKKNSPEVTIEMFDSNMFLQKLSIAGLLYSKELINRFVASVLTKPFVILTGLSGSGKTKLAQAFAKWICADKNQFTIIPVGADWTNREPLLGYPNALEDEKYILPDNGALKLMIEAAKPENEDKPYFLILDEMNLSHVERYFADFLSAMESNEAIPLHNGSQEWNGVKSAIALPKNLFIIGTVNIDETTYMFSPKVLDRANVIEFRVSDVEMEKYLESAPKLNLDKLAGFGSDMAADFLRIAINMDLEKVKSEEINATLLYFFSELKKTGAEFGYRSASEILRFTAVTKKIDPTWKMDDIIDAAIMQKLLPKVHGSRKKLDFTLQKLGEFCLNEKLPSEIKMDTLLNPKEDSPLTLSIKYPLTFEKISRMYRNLVHNGFTSYAEV